MTQELVFYIVSSSLTTILALLAIYFSLKTSRKQNKIDLWEKRFEIYDNTILLLNTYKAIKRIPEQMDFYEQREYILSFIFYHDIELVLKAGEFIELEKCIYERSASQEVITLEERIELRNLKTYFDGKYHALIGEFERSFKKAKLLFPYKISRVIYQDYWHYYGHLISAAVMSTIENHIQFDVCLSHILHTPDEMLEEAISEIEKMLIL